MLNKLTLLIFNRRLPLVINPINYNRLITCYHHSSTDQWNAGIRFLKHSKKLILKKLILLVA